MGIDYEEYLKRNRKEEGDSGMDKRTKIIYDALFEEFEKDFYDLLSGRYAKAEISLERLSKLAEKIDHELFYPRATTAKKELQE